MVAARFRITRQRRVHEENDGHIDLLMRVEPLLLEAKALDLVEINAGRLGRHHERRMPDDRLIGEVLGREEHELLLAEMNPDLALGRLKAPRQIARDVAVEAHRNHPLRYGRSLESALCVVPPNPVAAQNSRYSVGEYATRPIIMPIKTMHGTTTFKFLRRWGFIVCLFFAELVVSLLHCVAMLVHHRTHISVLHGANLGNGHRHLYLARLFEGQA